MNQTLFYDSHPFVKLIIALFISLVVFLVFMIIAILVALPVFHLNIFELQEIFSDFENVHNIAVLKYFQIIQTLGLFVVPPFVIAFFIDYIFLITFIRLFISLISSNDFCH